MMGERRFRWALVLTGALLCLPLPAAAQPLATPVTEARTLLADMASAYRSRTFTGRLVYLYGNDVTTLAVRHAVIDGIEYERLSHLDGRAELLRVGQQVLAVHPDGSVTRMPNRDGRSVVSLFDLMAEQLPAQYSVLLDGDARVAGRSAIRLRVRPLDNHRYGYRLWVDRDSKLLLKSETLDPNNAPLERMEFVQLELSPPLTAADFAPPPTHRYHAIEDLGAIREISPNIEPGWLPAGFVPLQRDLRRSAPVHQPVAALAYGDGLASFTLFVQGVPEGASVEQGVSRMGPTLAMTRHAQASQGGGLLLVLVGEIPQDTAERIMDHVVIGGHALEQGADGQ